MYCLTVGSLIRVIFLYCIMSELPSLSFDRLFRYLVFIKTREAIVIILADPNSCIGINDVYIIAAVRTPIGNFQGKLGSLSGVQLATKALTATIAQANIPKEDIEEIIVGNVFAAGMGQCPAHQIALFSGLPDSIVSSVINKACSSGMKAVMIGAQMITSRAREVVVAGGTESLTNLPFILKRKNLRTGTVCLPDILFHDGLHCFYEQIDITLYAEETVKEHKITREEQDDYSVLSFKRALDALDKKIFADEMTSVCIKTPKGEEVVSEDENLRRFNEQKLRSLQPSFAGGTITAGNSSALNDGAAMLIICSGNYVLKKNLKPMAKILSYCDVSLAPRKFCLAPSACIPKALVLANLRAEDIDRWEISETFAMTPMVNSKILQLNNDKVNIYGGAVSLGHPFGMTGTRLIGHLAHTLKPGETGVASISHGAGGASTVIIRKMC